MSSSTWSTACGENKPYGLGCAESRKPHAADVVGVITKEHVADSVAVSTSVYPAGAS
jgi:hypothetical protein